MAKYCRVNHIKLIIWIPPSHIQFQEKIDDYGLTWACERFKEDIGSIGDVYDFDYKSQLTRSKENFKDPLHFTDEIGYQILDEILNHRIHYSRVL